MSTSKVTDEILNRGNLGWGKSSGVGYKTKFLNKDSIAMPSDWLAINEPTEAQAMYGLFAVFDNDSNFLALQAQGAYTVDWGDGTVENFTNGAIAQHNYVWANVSSSTLTSEGFRQVIVKVTPQAGQNLSLITLQKKHSSHSAGTGGNSNPLNTPWLDIYIKGTASLTTLTIGAIVLTTTLNNLYRFRASGITATNTSYMFNGCTSLVSVSLFNTASVTDMSFMFQNCASLQSVPLFNTASANNMASMFLGCSSLQSVPLFNTASVTNMSQMFNGCASLVSVPKFNTISVTNMGFTFAGCSSLESVPLLNTASVNAMNGMFSGCASLQSVPLFNTAAVTVMNQMLQNCTSLVSVPAFNTELVNNMQNMFLNDKALKSVPLFNTALVQNMNNMFSGCVSLKSVPLFNTVSVTNMSNMFSNCTSLQSVPLFNTSSVTVIGTMFTYCVSLQSIPALDVKSAGDLNSISNANYSLSSSEIVPPASITYYGSKMSATELNRIYTSLPNRLNTTASSATGNGTTMTYTTTTNHGYIPGMVVTITGFTSTGYNQSAKKITAVTSNTFSFLGTTTGASSGTGTVVPAAMTINVTNNWGTSGDTPTIATNKGWTVTG